MIVQVNKAHPIVYKAIMHFLALQEVVGGNIVEIKALTLLHLVSF